MMTAKKSQDNLAIDLLVDDHKKVKKLFKDFDKLKEKGEPEEKQALVEEICNELILHTQIEEEIFYPAAREIVEEDMVNEAEVEHASAKDLIEQIQALDPSDPMYDAKVTVLGEYIEHHVEEEEKEMFPKVKKSKLDLEALGEEMSTMKEARPMQPMSASGKGKGGHSKVSSART
ncbi:hemerythrin domain-containing protein [Oxalobacteraceae bacterium R-40]|uniref:Hemerythrin domain-containing protein n=1 Tax=Keguizhuia sedimenti TaxID=3064264 RepID=A0ABU1BMD2_9BURK|nr:hemerythrin domain-containing protein [Oxalobacteraceae bacterium R-40]